MITTVTIKSTIDDFKSLAEGTWNNLIWIDENESNETFLLSEIYGHETLVSQTINGIKLTITQNEQTGLPEDVWKIINQLKQALEN